LPPIGFNAEKALEENVSVLTKADEYIEQLSAVISPKDWLGRFYDTRGFVSLTKARVTQTLEEKKALLAKAIADFELALQDEYLQGDAELVQAHLEEARVEEHKTA
jgi:hypothetical protein